MILFGANKMSMVTDPKLVYFKFKNNDRGIILLYNTRSHEDAYAHSLQFSQVLKLFLNRFVMKYFDDILVYGQG